MILISKIIVDIYIYLCYYVYIESEREKCGRVFWHHIKAKMNLEVGLCVLNLTEIFIG